MFFVWDPQLGNSPKIPLEIPCVHLSSGHSKIHLCMSKDLRKLHLQGKVVKAHSREPEFVGCCDGWPLIIYAVPVCCVKESSGLDECPLPYLLTYNTL